MMDRCTPEELIERRRARDRARYASNRDAMAAKNAAYYAKNKEREGQRCKAYREKNREQLLIKKRQFHKDNRDKLLLEMKEYRLADPEKTKQRDRVKNQSSRKYREEYNAKNKEKISQRSAKWARENPESKQVSKAKRRAAQLNAIPPWADKNEIKAIYKKAAFLTRTTGIKHEVDHILPLQNPKVCGLHWHENLQILTRSENRAKYNQIIGESL